MNTVEELSYSNNILYFPNIYLSFFRNVFWHSSLNHLKTLHNLKNISKIMGNNQPPWKRHKIKQSLPHISTVKLILKSIKNVTRNACQAVPWSSPTLDFGRQLVGDIRSPPENNRHLALGSLILRVIPMMEDRWSFR